MTDTSNPWHDPNRFILETEPKELKQARDLATERLRLLELCQDYRMRLEARTTILEAAIRFALSKVDRRTSYAKRLYSALNDTTRSVVPPNVKA